MSPHTWNLENFASLEGLIQSLYIPANKSECVSTKFKSKVRTALRGHITLRMEKDKAVSV